MDARETAMITLNASQRQGGWSDSTLKRNLAVAGLDSRDSALATRLCFGVLQNQMLLDFYLSRFSNIPLKRMEGKVLQALRLGAYQMLFLDKIPHSAAVNSSVALTRAHCKNPRAPGMVNGILRSLQRNLHQLPTIPREDPVAYLATLYSHPQWLVREFCQVLGTEQAEQLLQANNAQPPITAMVNTLRTDTPQLTQLLEGQGVQVQPHPWLSDCLILVGTGDLERLDAFSSGQFTVQDPASRLAILAAGPRPGMRVLDCCAAPGGKSFAAAIAMGNSGSIIACDLHPHKKRLIQAGAQRLGIDCITAEAADARQFQPALEQSFDLVLVDAPCSGIGVIRKKPDIRMKEQEQLQELPGIQLAILQNAARYVRPGGTLLYSTCTVLPQENEGVVKAFLAGESTFSPISFALPGPVGEVADGMITLWPHRHGTDGFFICKLEKRV